MVKQNPLRDLKTQVAKCDAELSKSLATRTQKTREADVVFGEKSIKSQAIQVEYTTPIIYALSQLVIAFRKYTEVLEKEVERKSKIKYDTRRKKKEKIT